MRLLFVCLISWFLVPAVAPGASADMTGKWSVDGSMNGNAVSFDCTFRQDDKRITGSCKGYEFAAAVTGSVAEEVVQFSFVYNFAGMPYTCTYTGTLTRDSELKGSIAVTGIDGTKGEFVAKKA
jgi:hypothetical protein